MPVPEPSSEPPGTPWRRTGRRALAGLFLLLCLAGCTPTMSGGLLPDRVGAAAPSPAPTVSAFTPVSTPSPAFTPTPTPTLDFPFTPVPSSTPTGTPTPVRSPTPMPSLRVSGGYDNPGEHADGRYELQLSGARVAAILTVSRSPVQYWAREVAAPLFTVPEPFRPPYSVLRTAEGIPVRADGTPYPGYWPRPRRFLLRVEPDGAVHYVDDAHVEGVGHLAYSLDTVWGTTPAANDRTVLEILDSHWFGEMLLSAEMPPVQFEVPEHSDIERGTIPGAVVGAFVTFDADGRVTALGAPTNGPKASVGAPRYHFNGSLLPELGQLHHLEHLDLGYQQGDFPRRPNDALTGTIPPQLGQLARLRHLDLQGQMLTGPIPPEMGRLVSLEYLDLGHNYITDPLPVELGRLVSLQTLNLQGNRLTALPSELGQLTHLQTLSLGDNYLTALPPELDRLASLQSLDLRGNRLTALPPRGANLRVWNGWI